MAGRGDGFVLRLTRIVHPFRDEIVNDPARILTIGHSNHSFEDFAALIRRHRVTVVADVRSVPYSRRHPQFNRRALEARLAEESVRYLFLGAELGARTPDPACYDSEGKVLFHRLAQTGLFLRGIARVLEEAAHCRLALLCAERDPANCHRAILVAPALRKRRASVTHILADGGLVSQEEVLDRLCAASGMPPRDMFRTREEQREEALARRAREIAWTDPARARATG